MLLTSLLEISSLKKRKRKSISSRGISLYWIFNKKKKIYELYEIDNFSKI